MDAPVALVDDAKSAPMDAPLAPMEAGLPSTPYRNCAALIASVIYQAIADKDFHWIASQRFNFYMYLMGYEPGAILNAKQRILNREVRVSLYSNPHFIEP